MGIIKDKEKVIKEINELSSQDKMFVVIYINMVVNMVIELLLNLEEIRKNIKLEEKPNGNKCRKEKKAEV